MKAHFLKTCVLAAVVGSISPSSWAKHKSALPEDTPVPQVAQAPTDFPISELQQAIEARVGVVVSREKYYQAQKDLDFAVAKAQRNFERSAPTREASDAEKKAYAEYQQARATALADLHDDPDYQALQSLRADVNERIARERASRRPDLTVIALLAQEKLAYATKVSRMEADALRKSLRAQAAKVRFEAAGQQVINRREQVAIDLQSDAQVLAARTEVREARTANLAAESYFVTSYDVAGRALDYAYYLHRYDDLRYSNGSYLVGYGSRY